MKNISLFQLIVTIAFGAFAAIGLFVFATYSGSSDDATGGPVVIWGTLPKTAFDPVLAAAAKENGLGGVTYVQKQEETFTQDYINAAAAGSAPDLLVLSSDQIMRLRHTLSLIPYESIPERNFRDTFIDATTILLAPEGVYGVPLATDPLMLYYNRPLLASSGIAEPPRTWEAVGAIVPRLAVVSERLEVNRAAIALGGYANIENAGDILTAFFLQAGVALSKASSAGGSTTFLTANDASGTAPADAVVRYYTAFANPAQNTYTWNNALPNSRSLFLSGDLALYLGFGSEYASLKAANPNLDFDMARIPQPGTATNRTTYGKVYSLVLPRASTNPSGALAVAFMFSLPAAEKAFLDAAGTLAPARRDLIDTTSADPVQAVIHAEALVSRGWLSPDPLSTDAIFGAMIANVVSGRTRIPEALTAAERALTAAYGL